MLPSPVGALDYCHIWNHLFWLVGSILQPLSVFKDFTHCFLWFMACTIHCQAVGKWPSRVENKQCEGQRFVSSILFLYPPSHLFYSWRSASFFADSPSFWNREHWTYLLQLTTATDPFDFSSSFPESMISNITRCSKYFEVISSQDSWGGVLHRK